MRSTIFLGVLLSSVASAADTVKLRVLTDVWPPFRVLNAKGDLQGLDIELLQKLSERTGIKFEVMRAPWARGLSGLENGSADMMTGLARTSDREAYIQYITPSYFSCSPRFYAKPATAQFLSSYGQLKGLRIGYVYESAYFEPFDSDPNLNKIGVNNEQQLLEMLKRDRIQAFIGTDCQVDYQLNSGKWSGIAAQAAYKPNAKIDLFIGLSRKRSNPKTIQRLSQALQNLHQEGWVTQAAARYKIRSE